MHLSSMLAGIYDFALANQVNANKIIIFFTTKLCYLKAPMKALIGFHRCYIPFPDSPSCSKLKSVCTILMHQLWANSWKYMCLRMMDCLHHVTATTMPRQKMPLQVLPRQQMPKATFSQPYITIYVYEKD